MSTTTERDAVERTAQALRAAFISIELAPPGGCKYVDGGRSCIVGQVLFNEGVPREILRGPYDKNEGFAKNEMLFDRRSDLIEVAKDLGLDTPLLSFAQQIWDNEDNTELPPNELKGKLEERIALRKQQCLRL